MDSFTYLLLDLAVLSIPLACSFHRRYPFYREWGPWVAGMLAMLLLFIPWDVAFTLQGVWGFNERYLTGWTLWHLPIEEWLFFVCIPYACIFTLYALRVLGCFPARVFRLSPLFIAAGVLLIGLGLWYHERAYTFLTFLLCGLFLVLHPLFPARRNQEFLFAFLLLLVPFALSNGLLTGLFTPEPVVWYNDGENLGIRLGTIPLEDVFYAYLMLGIHRVVFDRLSRPRFPAPNLPTPKHHRPQSTVGAP
ncbi:MAG: lycopene cyclase domain-containing protein [Bacteroidetes bacterium]|nr:MAG: lycopene cyclase domain-containing protein [Bacteroidota bacterium]